MAVISNGVEVISSSAIATSNNIQPPSDFYRRIDLGYMDTYKKGVIPLVCLDQSVSIGHMSYVQGRIELIRSNGCCYKGGDYLDFKMMKNYNSSTTYHFTEFHRNSTSIQKCRFTWNSKPWAGVMIYSSVHGHSAYFEGSAWHQDLSYQFGGPEYSWYIPYQSTSDNSIINSEIYNSLVNEG